MPVSLGIGSTILLYLLWAAPLYLLLLYPFSPQRIVSLRRAGAWMAGMLTLLVALVVLLDPLRAGHEVLLQRVVFGLHVAASLVFMRYNVSAPLPRRLFVLFLAHCYCGCTNMLAVLLRLALRQIDFITQMVPGLIFSHLFVLLITMPVMLYFMDNLLLPVWEMTPNEQQDRRLWNFPAIFFAIFAVTMDFVGQYETWVNNNLFLWFVVVVGQALGAFLSCGVLLGFLSENRKRQLAQQELQAADMMVNLQQHEYERLQDTIELTRKLRHDLRQQLAVLGGLAAEGDLDGIREFLQDYRQVSNLGSSTTLSDNFVASALLEYYIPLAQQYGIRLRHQVTLPPELLLPNPELASVLGNLLANAVEACHMQQNGERFVSIRALMPTEQTLAVIVQNSFEGPLERAGELFISRKRPGKQTGLGIASVRAVAERYNGVAEFQSETKDGAQVFTAKVLLNFG